MAWLIEINMEITLVIFSTGSNSQKSTVNCIMGYQFLILFVEICERVLKKKFKTQERKWERYKKI